MAGTNEKMDDLSISPIGDQIGWQVLTTIVVHIEYHPTDVELLDKINL
jgi:hypothetical protein